MWQSQVENKHYSYQFLTTFFDVPVFVTMSYIEPPRMLKELAYSNSYIRATTFGVYVQSIALGELIELS